MAGLRGDGFLRILAISVIFAILDGSARASKCPSPAIPVNAHVHLSNGSLESGDVATYTCDHGYLLFGSSSRKCSESGTWEGELPFCAVNVAYRKHANQSTTVRGGDANNAVDGNLGTFHDGKYCTETRREISPWWRVDLLQPYEVRTIRIVTRKCCGQRPLQDLEIRVGNSTELQKNRLCTWHSEPLEDGSVKDFMCKKAMVGRYVFIQMIDIESSLSLCEVQVFTTQEFSKERCANQSDPDHVAAFSKTCYMFQVKQGGNFQKARNSCIASGGDLLHKIKNTTQNFLAGELERLRGQMSTQLLWIGAMKEPGLASRTWRWVTGETITKPLWGEDQPNSYNKIEQNCAALDGARGWLWNDIGCNLDFLLWVCQSKPVSCGSPDRQQNTTIIGTDYGVGKEIDYKCHIDSVLVGDNTRTCLPSGFWNGTAPTCKYVNCGPLAPINNGNIELVDKRTTYGARAVASCHVNYTLIGIKERRCLSNGSWEGEHPTCLEGLCPEPVKILNATLAMTGVLVGDNVTYICNKGHKLEGTTNSTCLPGGKWSAEPPVCKYIDCGLPPPMRAGAFFLPDNATLYASRVTYRCADNHVLRGLVERTCQEDGQWSGEEPSCEIISCGEPNVNDGSFVVGYEFTVGALVEYSCDPGYLMEGESNRTCSPSGNWTGTAPTCTYIDCRRVQPIPYAVLDYVNETTHLGSIVTYECTASYKLEGSSSRTCQSNGKWDGASPSCKEIRCPEPTRPLNSILSVSGNDRAGTGDTFKIGSTIQRRCESGFLMQGEAIQSCEATGNWSAEPPKCIYIDCHQPEGIDNGKVTLATNTTSLGSVATYVCKENQELVGEPNRTCLEDGSWSGQAPTCQEITCGPPDKPPSVHSVEALHHLAGSVAVYKCGKGQTLIGNGSRSCERSGRWSGVAPECKYVDCGRPTPVQNGRTYLQNQTTIYNSSVEYHCFPAYKLHGAERRWCQENGTWMPSEPECKLDIESNIIVHGSSVASTGPREEDVASARTVGIAIGVGSGVLLLILIGATLIYMRMRAPKPVITGNDVAKDGAVVTYARDGLEDASNGQAMGSRGHLVGTP